MTTDLDRAISAAFQCLADSCLEHDRCHEQRALDELRRLGQIPQPRTPEPVANDMAQP